MEEKLSAAEKERYARHLNIPEIGEAGQLKLKSSSVLVVGAGGLGSASISYLAAAGIGKIGVVDSDKVELSNLQRQILHGMSTLQIEKVKSVQKRIWDLNPKVKIAGIHARVAQNNVEELLADYPIVVDATDNIESRYIINQACVKLGRTFIYGAIYQFYGQMSVFDASRGPCFQCVFRQKPSETQKLANRGVGVVGALPGVIGSMQALEAIKLLVGFGTPAIGKLLLFDGLDLKFQTVSAEKDPTCPICGSK
jgi:adenylyltransferase/sulfurtransferase